VQSEGLAQEGACALRDTFWLQNYASDCTSLTISALLNARNVWVRTLP
jgi:hypothetical protein